MKKKGSAHKTFSRSEAKKMEKDKFEAIDVYLGKLAVLQTHELLDIDDEYTQELRRHVRRLKMGLENRGAL